MIDTTWIGHEMAVAVLPIEYTRLRFFAKAIGETNPVYTDISAAKAAGYRNLLVPPTFLFAAELDAGTIDRLLADLGIPVSNLLHGEQKFSYLRLVFAGDTVTVHSKITDVYQKKNGELDFVVKSSRATNQHGDVVAEMECTLVCRSRSDGR